MLFEKRSDNFHVSQQPPGWVVRGYGEESYTGEHVTVESALTVPGVLNGFTILMEDTASLPLLFLRRLTRGKERAYDDPYYGLMHDMPNAEMTSMVFREIIMGHLLGWGNFYGQLIWDNKGVVREIYPLRPDRMEISRVKGERLYLYRTVTGKPIAFRQSDILHVPAFGFDGLRGYSRVTLARNAIGLAMGTEKYGSKVFANDARPSVVVTRPAGKDWTDKARTNFIESWGQAYAGSNNAAKTAVLEDGMDIKTLGFPSKDAQFIETQQWTISQIARVFRIPPHMLGDITNSTSWGSGIEQQELGYLTHTLRPWLVRIEQQLNKDLLLSHQRKDYFFEHLVDALLRTDLQTRMNAYAQAITNGIYTRNEVREKENLLPYEGGDEPLTPLNMQSGNSQNDETDNTDPANSQNDTNSDNKTDKPKRDITPLLMDALRRISKRDSNELQGALKRYAEKDDRFNAWAEQFYKRDYPEFIRQTFMPFVDAGLIQPSQLRIFIETMLEQRGINIEYAEYSALEPDHLLTLLQESHHA